MEEIRIHNQDDWNFDLDTPMYSGLSNIYKGRKLEFSIDDDIPKNVDCIIKIINKFEFINHKDIIEIIKKLKNNQHKNIIKFYGCAFENKKKKKLYIYMEYLKEFKSLSKILREGKNFDENEINNISKLLFEVLFYLKQQHIIHRDIKPDNILYNEKTGEIKLIDFDVSKIFSDKSNFYSFVGTPYFMGPEVKSEEDKGSSRSDIYSVGILILELLGCDISNIQNFDFPEWLSNKFRKMARYCLLPIQSRPSAEEMLKLFFELPIKKEKKIVQVIIKQIINIKSLGESLLNYDHLEPLEKKYKQKKKLSIKCYKILATNAVVLKIIDKNIINTYELEILEKLKYIKHENIVGILDYSIGKAIVEKETIDVLYVYMEYLDGYESLKEIILSKKFDELQTSNLVVKIIFGLIFLDEQGIYHGDIKSSNILFNQKTEEVKLVDVGISGSFYEKIKNDTVVDDLHTARHTTQKNDQSLDILDIGYLVLEILGVNIKVGADINIDPIFSSLSNDCKNFYQLCICDSDCRPNAIELLGHGFLNNRNLSPSNQINKNNILSHYKSHIFISNNYLNIFEDFKYGKDQSIKQYYETVSSISHITIPENFYLSYLEYFPSVKHITLKLFNPPISPDSPTPQQIPKSPLFNISQFVTRLTLNSFNQPITQNLIPESITCLELSNFNLEKLESLHHLPSSIKTLILPLFNQPIKNQSIPKTIRSLEIPSFDNSFEDFENSLTELKLCKFNYISHGSTIPDIKKLTCSYFFETLKNTENKNIFPQSIQILILDNYNQSIEPKSIPERTIILTLGSDFTHFETLEKLPKTITSLKFGVKDFNTQTKDKILENINPNITNLTINNKKINIKKK